MRYVIENTEAFQILAKRARDRELAHAVELAGDQLSRIAKNPARRHVALALLAVFVVAGLVARALLPVEVRIAVATALMLVGSLAIPGFLLGEILMGNQPTSRHSQP
jgi:hypothetical protein